MVEDAYSPRRKVEPLREDLKLPGILERKKQTIHAQQHCPMEGMRLVDVQFLPQPVSVQSGDGEAMLDLSGQFQVLGFDMEGHLRSGSQKWEHSLTMPMKEGETMDAVMWPAGKSLGSLMSGTSQLSNDVNLETEMISDTPIPMVTALELGELQQPDSRRPSLILKKSDGKTLWQMAKETGSTVSFIREANHLDTEPDNAQMLLIPVE